MFRLNRCRIGRGIVASALFWAGVLLAQTAPSQQPGVSQQTSDAQKANDARDLKPVQTKKAATTVDIPRSYALVIGISSYKNLPAGKFKALVEFLMLLR